MDSVEAKFEKSFGKEIMQSSNLHLNLGQDYILTTEDKVRLCMTNHANGLATRSAWVGPVSLFVAILLVLITADFKDALYVPKATWHAIFLLAVAGTGVWSVVSVVSAFHSHTSIDHIVNQIKATSQSRTTLTQQKAEQSGEPESPIALTSKS